MSYASQAYLIKQAALIKQAKLQNLYAHFIKSARANLVKASQVKAMYKQALGVGAGVGAGLGAGVGLGAGELISGATGLKGIPRYLLDAVLGGAGGYGGYRLGDYIDQAPTREHLSYLKGVGDADSSRIDKALARGENILPDPPEPYAHSGTPIIPDEKYSPVNTSDPDVARRLWLFKLKKQMETKLSNIYDSVSEKKKALQAAKTQIGSSIGGAWQRGLEALGLDGRPPVDPTRTSRAERDAAQWGG